MSGPSEDRAAADEFAAGDVLAILYRQHADITTALERVAASVGDERATNLEAAATLIKSHEGAEQQVVRPVAERADAPEAAKRTTEENAADLSLAELRRLDLDSPDFDTMFATFKQSVADHAEREERDEFPLLQAMPEPERLALGEQFLAAQETSTG